MKVGFVTYNLNIIFIWYIFYLGSVKSGAEHYMGERGVAGGVYCIVIVIIINKLINQLSIND